MLTSKKCLRCDTVKPISAFWRNRKQATGYDPSCVACRRNPPASHLERKAKGMRRCRQCDTWKPPAAFYAHGGYIASPCRECQCKRVKARAAKPGMRAALAAYGAEWQKKNKLKVRQSNQRYGARKRGAPVSDLTEAEWAEILVVHDHRCAYCLRRFAILEKEHIIALNRGGEHTASNVIPACRSCNATKSDRPIFVMAVHAA